MQSAVAGEGQPYIKMNILKVICRCIDLLNIGVGRLVAWTTALVVLVVFVDVVMRYAFKTSFVFTQELEWHLFAFIFLIGAGYTLFKDGHVRVDIFYQRLSPKARAWVNYIGTLLFLVPGCILIILTSIKFVHSSFAVMEGSPDPGGIPFRWILKACIPAGFVLLLLQGGSIAIKNGLLILLGRQDLDSVFEPDPVPFSLSWFLLSFKGRITREQYWLFVFTILGVGVSVRFVLYAMRVQAADLYMLVYHLLYLWPAIAVQVKRWHDRGKPGWWTLVNLVPLAGSLYALVENGFLKGTEGENQFGRHPLASVRQ